jgi:RNA polymerase sigma factor (sigma-70 family)
MAARDFSIARFYEAERDRLRSFVRRFVRNPVVAEDLVQQAFTNLLSNKDVSPETAAYFRKAVRNLALNHLRDEKRRADVEVAGLDANLIADSQPSPEMVVLYRSELRQLLEIILQLPARRREAFVLNRIEGLSYDEIAQRMGITRNTVISQIVAAMAELDRRLPGNDSLESDSSNSDKAQGQNR